MDEQEMNEQMIDHVLEILKKTDVGHGKFIMDMSAAIEALKKPLPLPAATVFAMLNLLGQQVDVHTVDGSLHSGIFYVPPVQPELGIQLLGSNLEEYTMEKNKVDAKLIQLDSIMKIMSKGVQVLVENGEWNIVNIDEKKEQPHFVVQKTEEDELQYIAPRNLQYREPRQTSFASSSQTHPFHGYHQPSLQYIAPRQTSFASSSQRPPFLGYQQQNLNPGSSHNAAGFGNLNNGHDGHAEPGINMIEEEFQIDTEKIARGDDTRTSLMLRNIPRRYTSEMLMAEINENSQGTYDFFHLPMKFNETYKNMGIAFINMVSPLDIIQFYKDFNGRKWENSEKVASLVYAKHQGIHSLVEARQKFQKSMTIEFRPTLFLLKEQYQELTQYSHLNILTREARSDEKKEEN